MVSLPELIFRNSPHGYVEIYIYLNTLVRWDECQRKAFQFLKEARLDGVVLVDSTLCIREKSYIIYGLMSFTLYAVDNVSLNL